MSEGTLRILLADRHPLFREAYGDVSGDYATFGSGARLAGRVMVGEGAYIGSGARIRESLHVGAWSLVGMGSVVLSDVPPAEVWVGTPARRLRRVNLPLDLAPFIEVEVIP